MDILVNKIFIYLGNTSNLLSHLKSAHRHAYQACVSASAESAPVSRSRSRAPAVPAFERQRAQRVSTTDVDPDDPTIEVCIYYRLDYRLDQGLHNIWRTNISNT